MSSEFIDWARSVAADQVTAPKVASVTVGEMSDNRSAQLDIGTPNAIARITCWESGDYDAEIVDVQSEQSTYARHGILHEGELLWEQFREALRCIKCY